MSMIGAGIAVIAAALALAPLGLDRIGRIKAEGYWGTLLLLLLLIFIALMAVALFVGIALLVHGLFAVFA